MHRTRALAVLGAIGCVGLGAPPALARGGDTVACGQHLVASVRLANDLTGCAADGVVVDADGVTVDLNGHTIGGSGAGIGVRSEHARTTVENGTITGFSGAININGPPPSPIHDAVVRGIVARDNAVQLPDGSRSFGGIAVVGPRAMLVDNVVQDGSIAHFGGGQARLEHNTVSGGDEGIILIDTADDRMRDNHVSDVGDVGILVFGTAARDAFERNRITHAAAVGILVEGPDDPAASEGDNTIADNTIADSGDGIIVFQADRTTVRGNTATGSGTAGDPAAPGIGIWFDGVSHGVIDRNTVTGGRGRAISIGAQPDEEPSVRPSVGNLVSRNTAQSTGDDGIRVLDVARDTTLEGNIASGNGADGIHVLSPATTLTRNVADRNRALGIEAVAGVVDGGRNEATANGDPRECVGVACS